MKLLDLFIDESGIHKQIENSTVAIVYVLVDNTERLEKLILKTEKDLHIENFHWSKHIWKIKRLFVQSLQKKNFTVKIAVIENPFNEGRFEEAVRSLLIEKDINYIILDGKKPKRYLRKIKNILRGCGISVKKIRSGNDKSYPVLRLADAYAGLTRSHWENRDKKEIADIWKIAHKKITTQLLSGQAVG